MVCGDTKEALFVTAPEPPFGILQSKLNLMTSLDIKVLSIGDPTVGKTLLFIAYARQTPQHGVTSIPDTYDGSSKLRNIGGRQYCFCFWDTPGWDDLYTGLNDRLRRLLYPGAHICFICFSLDDVISYENVRTKWYPELRAYGPESLVFLIGTKKDLRDRVLEEVSGVGEGEEEGSYITYDQGVAMAKEIGAERYLECSALTGEGVNVIFTENLDSMVPRIKIRKTKSGSNPCRCIIV